jgi:PAS domain S-box-containing protein
MASIPAETILIVDDDDDTRANLRDVLELDDYRIESAGTAAEVLSRRNWSEIGVVVLDRRLPDGNAQELLPHIKRVAPHVSVVVVTGFADVESAVSTLKQGAEDYILKPIDSHELRIRIGHILDRKRTRLALERTEQWFRELAENIDQVFWVCDDALTEILYVSPAFSEIWGVDATKLVAHPRLWLESVHPDDRPRIEHAFFNIAMTRRYDEEYRIVRPDGAVRWIHERRSFLRGKSNAGGLLGGIATDISERKANAERAMQAERLAAIGETMAGLAHESRNALQRSKACLEMLVMEVEDRPEALDLVARTMRAQEHLQQLYEEVRQYAAPIVLNREPVDVCHLWREIWADVSQTHNDKTIQIQEHCDGGCLECEVDRFALGRVFRNILENALDAAPDKSTLEIWSEVVGDIKSPMVRIRFRDHGPGIPVDQRTRIFEPFFTTKTKGTGLGMAIAKRIVESHGGGIAVAGPSDGGAEIVVILPRGNV